MMHECLREVNSKQLGASKAKLKLKCLSGLVNCRLKFWYIEEIGKTLTMCNIVSSAVCGQTWRKMFRETSMNKLVHQGSQFELRAKLNRGQWSFLSTGVIRVYLLKFVTILAALFWIDCNL